MQSCMTNYSSKLSIDVWQTECNDALPTRVLNLLMHGKAESIDAWQTERLCSINRVY